MNHPVRLAIHNVNNCTEVEDIVIQFSHQFLRNSSPLFDNQYLLKSTNPDGGNIQFEESDKVCSLFEQLRHISNLRVNAMNNPLSSIQSKFCLDLELNLLCLKLISLLLSEHIISIDSEGATYSEIISIDPLINEILKNPGNPINMQVASHMTGMSYSHFSRVFLKITGFHYTEFCNLLRIRKAEELLLTTTLSIAEIASAIGIDTLSYFTRLFKKVNGTSPSTYRKLYL